MSDSASAPNHAAQTADSPARTGFAAPDGFAASVRRAVIWRSGTQILGQLVAWFSTFFVIRILHPEDYGLAAMTGVVLVLLNMLNGYGLASGFVQKAEVTERDRRQLLGLLIAINGPLLLLQALVAAPLAAWFFAEPRVADLLIGQAFYFLAGPPIAYGQAVLSRAMDFRAQATINLASAVAGALTAIAGALGGLGVWTLILAPGAMYGTRALGLAWVTGLPRPSFDFRGAGAMLRFGGFLAVSQCFWFIQSQADVTIAGRLFDAHTLGLYATALMLTQIFTAKIVPPINEVAFSAYARLEQPEVAAAAFMKAVRLVMLAALPFYAGLAVVAEPLVAAVLGPQWLEAAPLVRLLAVAMPAMTVNILFSPACDARGRADITAKNGLFGAVLLPVAFLVGAQWGVAGIAWAWILAYPLYTAASAARTLPVLGIGAGQLAVAVAPPLLAALAMAALVELARQAIAGWPPVPQLALLVAVGGAGYAAALLVVARAQATEFLDAVIFRRRAPTPLAA